VRSIEVWVVPTQKVPPPGRQKRNSFTLGNRRPNASKSEAG